MAKNKVLILNPPLSLEDAIELTKKLSKVRTQARIAQPGRDRITDAEGQPLVTIRQFCESKGITVAIVEE